MKDLDDFTSHPAYGVFARFLDKSITGGLIEARGNVLKAEYRQLFERFLAAVEERIAAVAVERLLTTGNSDLHEYVLDAAKKRKAAAAGEAEDLLKKLRRIARDGLEPEGEEHRQEEPAKRYPRRASARTNEDSWASNVAATLLHVENAPRIVDVFAAPRYTFCLEAESTDRGTTAFTAWTCPHAPSIGRVPFRRDHWSQAYGGERSQMPPSWLRPRWLYEDTDNRREVVCFLVRALGIDPETVEISPMFPEDDA